MEKITRPVFIKRLDQIRQGKLRIPDKTDVNQLREYARNSIWNINDYISALEDGYRILFADGYEKRLLGHSGKTPLADMRKRQWSANACLGYALMALRGTGVKITQAIAVLEAMEECMDLYSLEEAAVALARERDQVPFQEDDKDDP